MRKEQFIQFIEAPAIQQGESAALLSQLTKQYPYCQTAQLLLAKALHNQNSIRYSDQLKVAAAYASDRKVLYQLIMTKAPVAATASTGKQDTPPATLTIPEDDTELLNNLVETFETGRSETEKTKKPETEKKETFKNQTPGKQKEEITGALTESVGTVETPTIETPEPPTQSEEPETRNQKLETSNPELETRNQELETQNPEPEIINIDELPLLEQNILVEAIDASIELEVSENMPFRETEELAEETAIDPAAAEAPVSTDGVKTEEPEEEFDPNKTYSFTEWLRLSKKAKAKDSAAKKPVDQEEKQADPAEKEEKGARRKTLDDLIDKFITEEPKISRPSPKQEFFSPVNKARQSVQDDNDFVTETLANIYLKQGSFAKALKAYETLSLKFPEKKLYFAARIKEIKKIIKEQK